MADDANATSASAAPDAVPSTTPGHVGETMTSEALPVSTMEDVSGGVPEEGTEMKDEDVAIAGAAATIEVNAPDGDGTTEAAIAPTSEDANGTPATSHKAKRKSSGGVPEHKMKKLNKRKSMPNLQLSAKPGDYYWARLKGYPPWPAIVCDEEMLPETLLSSRPISTKRPDGTYREDFVEGGKNARERTYPIMFLSTNEFAWLVNSSMVPLDMEDVKNAEQGKKSRSLWEAYQIAAEGHDLAYFKTMLAEHDKSVLKDLEAEKLEEEEREAAEAKKKEKAEKAKASKTKDKKAKRKSTDATAGDDDVDMEDVEDDAVVGTESAKKPKSSKKRKKEADSEGEEGKPKKTPKTLKLNAPKTPNGDSATKAKTKSSKPKKTVVKPKVDSDDGNSDTPKLEDTSLTEKEKLERREKSVLYIRHRLQKGLLSRDAAPKEEEMATMAEFFTQLENHTDLEVSIIKKTKINKVLKAVVKLNSIPKEEEFNFKKRSADLLATWNKALAQAEADGPMPAEALLTAVPGEEGTSNGIEKEEKADEPASEIALPATTATEGRDEVMEKPSAAPVETGPDAGNDAGDEAAVAMEDIKKDDPAPAEGEDPAVEAAPVAEETTAPA
ncbi:hypothetical protein LTR04_005981 [Oleoguttula sp. CCFEE 6159]|nr:hypothetical protein LTR04_005981 [Oleoguttula sp. CCFEE 6159]